MTRDQPEAGENRYHYVFLNVADDMSLASFGALSHREAVESRLGALPLRNQFLEVLHKVHWSAKVNRIVNLPLKRLWFRAMYGNPSPSGRPLCFVYLGGKYAADDYGFTQYVRQRDPRNKQIIVYFDLIAKKRYADFADVRRKVDLVFTHDVGESQKYGVLLDTNRTYSALAKVTEPTTFDNDVFFIGYAKDRLSDIVDVHRTLTGHGLRCDFRVLGVPTRERVYAGLGYLDDPVPYRQSLELLKASKCVLEIVQHGSESATLRVAEAIVFRRKLLSNARALASADYFNPAQMSIFHEPGEIDFTFVEGPLRYEEFSTDEVFSPARRLRLYDDSLAALDRETGRQSDDEPR